MVELFPDFPERFEFLGKVLIGTKRVAVKKVFEDVVNGSV